MAVTQRVLTVDLTLQNAGFHVVALGCGSWVDGLGWQAQPNCGGNNQLTIELVNDGYPIAFNQQIIGIAIHGNYSGPRGTIAAALGLTNDPTIPNTKIIAVGGGSFDYGIPANSGGFGVHAPMFIAASSVIDSDATLYITQLTITVNEDDTIVSGGGGTGTLPPPQVIQSGDCNVAISYQYGIGPACADTNDVFALTSGYSTTGNILSLIFSKAVELEFLYQDFWDITAEQSKYIMMIESPLGTSTNKFLAADYPQPTDIKIPLLVTKLEVFGPVTNHSFNLYVKIRKIYGGDTGTTTGLPTDFTAITSGLDGIKQAIDDEKSTLNASINNGIGGIADGFSGLVNNLPKNLVAGILDGITGLPNGTFEALLANISLPNNWSNDLVNWLINLANLLKEEIVTLEPQIAAKIFADINNALLDTGTEINASTDKQTVILNNLLSGKYNTADSFYHDLNANFPTGDFLVFLQNIITIFSGVFAFIHAKSEIVEVTIKQLLFAQYTPLNNDLNTNVRAYFKQQIDRGTLNTYASKQGLSISKVDELLSANRPLPSLQEIKDGFLRGYIDQPTHDAYLSMYGFASDSIMYIREVYQTLLGPSDITRIADKHIFNNDIPTIFGQYDELDSGFVDAMAMWGINEDWTKKYWAAHWSIPGFEQAFDMWHRKLIDDNELDTYFSLTDIMPFFREKLKGLSHALIGRVDIRRFYAQGVYSQADVLDAYKKLGYSDADAQKQTDFTVEHERQSEAPAKVKVRTLTEGMVVKAYKSGNISHDDAIARLGKVGYLPDDAAEILKLETQIANTSILADKTQHYHDKAKALVIDSLSKGVIGEQDARGYLATLGVPQAEIESEIAYADIDRITHLKTLVTNKVKSSYEQGMIDKPTAINLMLTQGFSMNEVQIVLDELDIVLTLRNKPLTEKQIEDLYNAGIIDNNDVIVELTNLGYTEKHVMWLSQKIFGVA